MPGRWAVHACNAEVDGGWARGAARALGGCVRRSSEVGKGPCIVKALVAAAAGLCLAVSASPAWSDVACCDSWLSQQYSNCIVRSDETAGPCPPSMPVQVVLVEDRGVQLVPGSTPCVAMAQRTCCGQDCAGEPSCVLPVDSAPLSPSCCVGYCGEVYSTDAGPSIDIPASGGGAGDNTAACTASTLYGACYPGAIQLPPVALGPVLPPTAGPASPSPEWVVSFGDTIQFPPDASDEDAGAIDAVGGGTKSCGMAPGVPRGGARSGLVVLGIALVGAMRRRRAQRPSPTAVVGG
jgi:hypothetical protein